MQQLEELLEYHWSSSRNSNCIFYFNFSLTTVIIKKLLNITRKKKKKHDQVLMLAKSKLNSIDTLISQTLIDMDISHEEFITKGKR